MCKNLADNVLIYELLSVFRLYNPKTSCRSFKGIRDRDSGMPTKNFELGNSCTMSVASSAVSSRFVLLLLLLQSGAVRLFEFIRLAISFKLQTELKYRSCNLYNNGRPRNPDHVRYFTSERSVRGKFFDRPGEIKLRSRPVCTRARARARRDKEDYSSRTSEIRGKPAHTLSRAA